MRRNATFTAVLIATALPAQKPETVQAAVETIAALASTPEQRGAAFLTVRDAPFALVAGPLVRAMQTCRVRRGPNFCESGCGPRTETPWLETGWRVEQVIAFTLGKAWWEHERRAQWPDAMRVVMPIIEDASAGESRTCALSAIPCYAGVVRDAATVVPDLRQRLEKIARVDKVPWIRARACMLLAQEGEKPEALIDLAFEIAGTEAMPVHQADLLGQTGIIQALPRMGREGRRVLLQRSFALLRRIDDGKGAGYFLASALGQGLEVAPVSRTSVPFSPDPSLPGYESTHGRAPRFFQETVANALAWYEKHKDD